MRRARVTSTSPLRVHRQGDTAPIAAVPTSVTVDVGDDVLVEIVARRAYIIVRIDASTTVVSYGNLLLREQSNVLRTAVFEPMGGTSLSIRDVRPRWGALRVAGAGTTATVVTLPVATHGATSARGYVTGRTQTGVEARVGHRALDDTLTVIDQSATAWGSQQEPTKVTWDITLPAQTAAVQVLVQVRADSLPSGPAGEFSRLGVIVGASPVTDRPDWCAGGQINAAPFI